MFLAIQDFREQVTEIQQGGNVCRDAFNHGHRLFDGVVAYTI